MLAQTPLVGGEALASTPPVPPLLKEATALAQARQGVMKSILDNLSEDLADVASELVADLNTAAQAAVAGGRVLDEKRLGMFISAFDLRGMLDDAGFDEAVEAFLFQYQELLEMSAADMAVLGVNPAMMSTDLQFLQSLAESDGARWSIMGDELAEVARRAILGTSVGGLEYPAIVKEVSEAINASFARSNTIARTMLMAYERQANEALGDSAGATHYLYVGVIDGLTRPFCQPLVGKVLTKKQIISLENGQIDPVITFGGGFNCRHHWQPVPPPDPQDDWPVAGSKDISRAQSAGKKGRGGPTTPKLVE